jgi:cell division protein FtsA
MAASKIAASEVAIRAIAVSSYSGYDESGFFEPKALAEAIKTSLVQVQGKIGAKVKQVVVGVPAMFITHMMNEAKLVFNSHKKIDAYDIDDLFKKARIFEDNPEKVLVGRNALCYFLDDSLLEYNPIGSVAERISAVVSFSLVSRYFVSVLENILSPLGIKAKFANATELQSVYINNLYAVGGYTLVVDIGHISSTFAVARGKGAACMKSFALGSGYFAADISQVFDISYTAAENIVANMNLRLDYPADATYTDEEVSIPAAKANEVVKARIEQFAEYIIKCFNEYSKPIPSSTHIVLTGGGLAYMKGALEILSQCLGRDVILFGNIDPHENRNELTSCYGLIHYSGVEDKQKLSFLSIIKNLFGGNN